MPNWGRMVHMLRNEFLARCEQASPSIELYSVFSRALVRSVKWKIRSVSVRQPALLLSQMVSPIDLEESLKTALPTPPPKKPVHCVRCGKVLTGLCMVDRMGEIQCPKCVFLTTA